MAKELADQNAPKTNKNLITLLIVIVVVLALALGYFYFQGQSRVKVDPGEQLDDAQVEAITKKVRRHLVLPEDEEPLVATIVDIESLLLEQPFYQGAQNGDVLLVYGNLAKAIIYNPREDRLVNVGPVQVNQDAIPPAQVGEDSQALDEQN